MEILHFKVSVITQHSQLSNSKLRLLHLGVDSLQLINHWPLFRQHSSAKLVQESVLLNTFLNQIAAEQFLTRQTWE